MTLLGVGAMNSPRFAPAGLLLRFERSRIAFRRLAVDRQVEPQVGGLRLGALAIDACRVVHTSHPTYGYRIQLRGLVAVWAPEFYRFPEWAAHADLLFADASSWNRPIQFRGRVGGHASVRDVEAWAIEYGVRRVVYAHIGRPCIRAIDAGLKPRIGEWGREGATYTLP
jgi:hypothetical protein